MRKYQYSSKFILILGFSFVVLIIGALTVSWVIHVSENKGNMEGIFNEQTQSRLLVTMRDAARQRAIYLHRMTMMNDPFDRDAEYLKFKEAAVEFIKARETLLGLESEASRELEIWNRARPLIQDGQTVQLQIAELILEDKIDEANELLLTKVIPIQNKVNETLSAMFGVQKQKALEEYNAALDRNQRIFWVALLAGVTAIVLAIIVATIVIRRTTQVEESLHDARLDAQKSTEMKSQFLANMSHEIRTPLTAVIGYAEEIIEQKLSAQEQATSAGRILRNGRHLLHVINDILDISKIEAGQLVIEKIEVPLAKLMLDIDSLIGDRIRDKQLYFKINYLFPVPRVISTDPTRLKQVLLNLCSNAMKFTESGGVSINVSFLQASSNIRFVVTDTGVGMNEEEMSRLFKAFSQADESTTRKYGGTGLGLYISQQLAHMLGGTIDCQSKKDVGSTFSVTVDAGVTHSTEFLYELDLDAISNVSSEKYDIPNLCGKVLLAEDSEDNQRLISLYVRNTGADVYVVSNGEQAVEVAVSGNFDLILMDMQMPVMGGLDAVQWLRRTGNQTPVAMLTANAMKEEKDKCLSLGANDFLTKPIDRPAFYKTVAKYLQASHQAGAVNQLDCEDVLKDLVYEFIASLPRLTMELNNALALGDWAAVQRVVHTMKGLGGGFGFPKITEISINIENKLKSGNYDAAINFISELLNYCDELQHSHTDGVHQMQVNI